MIRINNLSFGYGDTPLIFQEFNLTVDRGEGWAIIGPSGCGKTTLLYLLAGLRRPLSGEIFINEELISRPRPRTGLVLQDHGLLPWATVFNNARLGLTIWEFYGPDGKHAPRDHPPKGPEADKRVEFWLKRLDILHLRDRYPIKLSRGQRQRTAIARTLAMEPDLLLLDEPFSALDAPTREDLERLVLELNSQQGLTYLLVTHDIQVAVSMGAKILILQKGQNSRANVIENPCWGQVGALPKGDLFLKLCEKIRLELGGVL